MFFIHHSVCELGYYGLGCNQECSPFCLRSRDCHHVSGYCKEGCKNGWQGLHCLEGLFHKRFKAKLLEFSKCNNHAEDWWEWQKTVSIIYFNVWNWKQNTMFFFISPPPNNLLLIFIISLLSNWISMKMIWVFL